MFLLVIQLFDVDYKDDLFMALSAAGVQKTTYCDGHNLDNELRNDIPLFRGLFKSGAEKERHASVYFCHAKSEEQADAVISGFDIAGIDWKAKEIFSMMLIPISKIYEP